MDTFKIDKPIRLIELFAGVGSQAMALKDLNAGFEHHKVVEVDKKAIASYNAIHKTNFAPIDIRDVKAHDLGVVDTDRFMYIMTYSFPCQDLSMAGSQKGMAKGGGTRSSLLWEVERLLKELDESEAYSLPQVLLMENVPMVHGKRNIKDFNEWKDFLRSLGYNNFWKDLNAVDFGVPQNRIRCFMVSLLGGCSYRFPKKTFLRECIDDYCEDGVPEKFYINTETAERLIKEAIQNGTIFL